MKKYYFLLLLPFISFGKTSAQNYFPKGAIWYYHSMDWSSSSFSYTTLKSKGDTIFNGDTLTYLKGYVNCGAGWNELLKQVGQKVYKLNKCDSTYSLLYDFGANVGDTITTYPDICFAPDSIEIKIDSITPININGTILNKFYFTQLYPLTSFVASYYGWGSFIEGIGNTDSFYPYIGTCDPWGGPLRCYHDTIIGEYNSGLLNGVCDSVFVGIAKNSLKNNVKIFPNPTNGLIKISSDLSIKKIELFDLKGQLMLSTHRLILEIANYAKGAYLLKIYFKERIINKKIFKN